MTTESAAFEPTASGPGVPGVVGSCHGKAGRAAPMAPDDRRDAILRSTVPLLRERGLNVTTRELAEAAGVAEGTLFRVFPDKAALLRAAVERAIDPAPALADLAAIDRALDLRPALTIAVRVILSHTCEVAALLTALQQADDAVVFAEPSRSIQDERRRPRVLHEPPGGPGAHPLKLIGRALAQLLAPYRERLRRDPAVCARMLVAVSLAAARPFVLGPQPALTSDEIVELFLDGVLTTPEKPC